MSKAKRRPGYYSTTEVQNMLDISPKELRVYLDSGIISPSLKDGEGESRKYNYYDESAVRKIHIIKIYRDLDIPLEAVKSILDDPLKSNFDIISEQIRLLEEKKKKIDLAIAMDYSIINYGVDPLTATHNTEELYSDAEERKQRIKDAVTSRISTFSKTDLLLIFTEIHECLIKFEINKRMHKSPEAEETVALVKALLSQISKLSPIELNGFGVMNILDQARSNEYAHQFLTELTTDENLSYIHDCLFSYFLHCFEDETVYPISEMIYPFYLETEKDFNPSAFYEQVDEFFHSFCISAYKLLGVTCSEGLLNFAWPVFFRVMPDKKVFNRNRKISKNFSCETFYELIFYFACKYFDTHAEELGHEFYEISEKKLEHS